MTTTYRDVCGTAHGLQAHQEYGEPLCGTCAHAEAMRLLQLEAIPRRPSPPPSIAYPPITPAQAQINRRIILDAWDGIDEDDDTDDQEQEAA